MGSSSGACQEPRPGPGCEGGKLGESMNDDDRAPANGELAAGGGADGTTGAGVQAELRPGGNLAGADLRELDLRGLDLRRACLAGADLSNARLDDACLCQVDFTGANL